MSDFLTERMSHGLREHSLIHTRTHSLTSFTHSLHSLIRCIPSALARECLCHGTKRTRELLAASRETEPDVALPVLAEVHARYAAPARYGQELLIYCWIEELKSRGLTFAYEMVDSVSKVSHVTGHTRHICITHEGQVARIPDSWLKVFRE